MDTDTVVTSDDYKSIVPSNESRPIPQVRMDRDERAKRRMLNNDAAVAVLCLNESRGTEAYERLTSIRRKLEELRAKDLELRRLGMEIDKEMFPKEMAGPGRSGTHRHLALAAEFNALYETLSQGHNALLGLLARYAFRPSVSYTVTSSEWRIGLVPDADPDSFQTKFGQFTVTEADAVMSLVRLDAYKELNKVKLCEECRANWRVAIRPTYDRFCPGTACREAFYAKSPEYRERKAKNQREYRKSLKKAESAGAKLKEPNRRKARKQHAL